MSMFTEDDLIPISALQHFAFCERQWGLIHLEGLWAENRLTVEGKQLHERADSDETQVRGDVRIARGQRIRSLVHGLVGRADIVEFHKDTSPSAVEQNGIELNGLEGRWNPIPIEYKRGRVKFKPIDEIQLCAQALCLEEMLETAIDEGFLFYGKTRRRHPVTFSPTLRQLTTDCIENIRHATILGKTPSASYQKECDNCSLYDLCMPKAIEQSQSVREYLNKSVRDLPSPDDGMIS